MSQCLLVWCLTWGASRFIPPPDLKKKTLQIQRHVAWTRPGMRCVWDIGRTRRAKPVNPVFLEESDVPIFRVTGRGYRVDVLLWASRSLTSNLVSAHMCKAQWLQREGLTFVQGPRSWLGWNNSTSVSWSVRGSIFTGHCLDYKVAFVWHFSRGPQR